MARNSLRLFTFSFETAASYWSTTIMTSFRKIAPAAVNFTFFRFRSKSTEPSSVSRPMISLLRGDCDMLSRLAACPKCSSSATTRKARIRLSSYARSQSDLALGDQIEAFHRKSRSTCGRPRIHADLREAGIRVSGKRIARLMRERSIHGASRRKYVTTTVKNADARPAPDLVDRRFTAERIDQLWVADITYVPTWTGFLYVAIVLDAFSRRVVGWSLANHLRTELVLDALNMAIHRRRPQNVIHHSDQGTQYTSIAFGQRCKKAGVRPSMGSVGDCYDNAMCESFNATLECEFLDRNNFKDQRSAALAVFDFIEGWYNPHRRHSSIGFVSPAAFERRMPQAA